MTRSRPVWLQRLRPPVVAPSRPGSAVRPTEIPTPVTRDRVAGFLTQRGYTFSVDEDGDLTGTWDGNRFWFMVVGQDEDIVQVRGRWHRPLAPSSRWTVLQIINDWNRERIWPKTYLRSEADTLSLYTELSVDLGPGATADQLHQILACGLGTALQLFTSMAEMLPPEVSSPLDEE